VGVLPKTMGSFRLVLLCTVVLSCLCAVQAKVRVWGISGSGITGDPVGAPDPYVKVYCGNSFGGMTDFQKDTANPSWNVEFNFPNSGVGDNLKLEIWDKDLNYDDKLGTCSSTVKSGSYKVTCSFGKGTLFYHYST
uniref:C2 domain-containing protein n=1 Tax=Denticeps clupeoides TaxID=299321 RepID=A0AAY4CNU9_9TELE